MSSFTFKPLGDCGVRIQMGEKIDPAINGMIRSYCRYLEEFPIVGIVEWIPTYTAVTVFYQPHVIRYKELCNRLEQVFYEMKQVTLPPAQVITIPTLYGGEYGPDLFYVAKYHGMTVEELIQVHSQPDYLIYMMGFVPGFPYLGGMNEKIATPRLENPRSAIPAGSVGIAGAQTGIYPIETPGGWRLIGRTPIRLYDPSDKNPVLLKAGDYLRFQAIDEEEFKQIEEQVKLGTYHVERSPYKGGE
ncbi:5-oxoprolinase subunit PxpB [Microaerobacter geothermalis]|uniref:5-oxoprolinase subunit PxpB n=1 Tax=Microaerobacter geothermalis TaxID=674972 RepID=UPI001F41294C|nr:5-oxoprolinase subunit PxpB [Microaerobacter geothermalis]MCF6095065.1 5-oxoprolinase subunit PxpB [Microaerobacter geothermalis]